MENKFKKGDKVIFLREPTEEEWILAGEIFHELEINNSYIIIESIIEEKEGLIGEILSIDHENNGSFNWFPSEVFTLDKNYALKIELDNLKSKMLDSIYRIKLTRKDRRIFEALCKKFEIKINEGNRLASLEYPIVHAGHRLGYTGQNDICFFIKTEPRDVVLDFKDLIEPFKRFKDEIL
jgi:hypothetical protein